MRTLPGDSNGFYRGEHPILHDPFYPVLKSSQRYELAGCPRKQGFVFDTSIERCTTWSTARKHGRSAAGLHPELELKRLKK